MVQLRRERLLKLPVIMPAELENVLTRLQWSLKMSMVFMQKPEVEN
jgi:hypothetical protein